MTQLAAVIHEPEPDIERVLQGHNVTSAWRLHHEHQDGLVELRVGFDPRRLDSLLFELATARIGAWGSTPTSST